MKPAGSVTYQRFDVLDGLAALQAEGYQNTFAPHSHETYQITLVETGLFTNQISGRSVCGWPDSLVITHPGEVHSTVCDQPAGISFFTLYVSPDLFKHRNQGMAPRFDPVIHNHSVATSLRQIKHHGSANTDTLVRQVSHLLDQLLTEQLHDEVQHTDHAWLTDQLFDRIEQPFNLKHTAKLTGISEYKLIRLCKAETGMTPVQFVINQRILNSQQLLRQGTPIAEVAQDCGFYDAAHFHRHFKKLTGLTPASFQRPWLS